MARIKDTSVAEVKAAADIVEVVSARTSLRRASSSRFTGRCPFHEERTPSFSVDPVDKLYYCFGCGKGGDVVRFVQETENLDFAGAVEWLAERFRVRLEYEETSPQADAARRRRDRLTACRHGLVVRQATAVSWGLPADLRASPLGRTIADRLSGARTVAAGAACEIDLVVRPGLGRFTRPAECRLAVVAGAEDVDDQLARTADRIVVAADATEVAEALEAAG